MAICKECKQEMLESDKCTKEILRIARKYYKRNTDYYDVNERCHDCNIINKKGNVHHFSCDIERCPACKGQLLSCDCNVSGVLSIDEINNKKRKVVINEPAL